MESWSSGHNEVLISQLQGGADVNIATADGNYTSIHAVTLRNDLTTLKFCSRAVAT